jgi:hypothetical protein
MVLIKKNPNLVVTEVFNRFKYSLNDEANNSNNYMADLAPDLSLYVNKDTSLLLRGLESLQPALDECIKFTCLLLNQPPNQHLIDTQMKVNDSSFSNLLTMLWCLFDILLHWSTVDPNLLKLVRLHISRTILTIIL